MEQGTTAHFFSGRIIRYLRQGLFILYFINHKRYLSVLNQLFAKRIFILKLPFLVYVLYRLHLSCRRLNIFITMSCESSLSWATSESRDKSKCSLVAHLPDDGTEKTYIC